jgi:hypothetical protein
MKTTFKIISAILLTSAFSSFAFAQDIKLSDLLQPESEVKAQEITTLDQKEDERLAEFQNQLGFTLPEYTDNASYVITFSDPSPDKNGVIIKIDDEQERAITSPYAFSALGIGLHDITFKFTDKDGAPQEIEYAMTVLPRAPILKTPVYENEKLKLQGTGLAGSDVLLFISVGTKAYQDVTKVENDGQWSATLDPEEKLADGIYTIVAYTRKYGYASELSKPVVYQVGASQDTQTTEEQSIFFSFNAINKDNILDLVKGNRDLDILLGITFLLGGFLTLIISNIGRSRRESRETRRAQENISQTTPKKEKTLREIFQEKKEEKEDPTLEGKTLDKVITKEEFLKDFKSIDPDDGSGKETKQKKSKPKEVKVSLTSKEE